jgi:hypothetical protein
MRGDGCYEFEEEECTELKVYGITYANAKLLADYYEVKYLKYSVHYRQTNP